MKKCIRCERVKLTNCFYKHKKSKDGLQSVCKDCTKKDSQLRYENNKKSHIDYCKTKKIETLRWVRSLKSDLCCEICGESHPATLDFHHKNSKEKDFSVSYMAKNGFGKETILREIAKCNVWCSNCHRKFHWEEV